MAPVKPIYVIDATGFLFRSYFAIKGMTNTKGDSTNALYGFVRMFLKLMKDFDPEYIVAVFDGPNNCAQRKKIYPEYKANRTECPPDLSHQIKWARTFCELMGISLLNIPEVEADDTMGSIANWATKNHFPVFVCTSDKDMCQLVDETTKILQTHKDNRVVGQEEVKSIYGITSEQMIDYLAIVGDSSDNVPGLPGFGPKTASQLLQEHQTLQALIDNPSVLKGKKRETLEEFTDQALLSKQLVTINTDVPVPHKLDFYKMQKPSEQQLQEFYTEMNFLSLVQELGESTKPSLNFEDHLINTSAALDQLIEKLQLAKEVCFDTETTSTHPMEAELVGIGFCIDAKEGFYIPLNGNLDSKEILSKLKPLFENKNIGFFAHNAKYDLHILENIGIQVANLCFDTILASYILSAHQRYHSLDALAIEHLNFRKISIKDLIGTGKKQLSMRDVPIEKVCRYCCEDVVVTLLLKELLSSQLKERKLEELYYKMELPLLSVLKKMERTGIYIDADYLKKMSQSVKEDISALAQEIYLLAGEEFNLNSPKQLSEILFEKMGITPPKKTATGYSTNAEVLNLLKFDYPIAAKLIDYRTLSKLQSTYLETLPKQILKTTGRVHCTFNQSVAATGRLSSQDPNLQNIPIRTKVGRKIRGAFRPQKKDWIYISADYSQIELRLLAHLSQDPRLLEAFHHNKDIHQHTAATVFGVSLDEVTPTQRYQAKAVNFGVIYGQQAFGLSQELGISMKEARSFIEKYFERYQKVKSFIESCKEKAHKTGKTVTLTGRERAIAEIHNKNPSIRNVAERLAINTPLQGTAADLIKLAMLRINALLQEHHLQSLMILQIHDELLFEAPEEEKSTLIPLIQKAMEHVWELSVPLTVDIAIGKNWETC